MNELIKTFKQNDGTVAVDARDLHDFLEVGKDFTSWLKDMIDYGFEEGKDFTPFSVKSTGGRPRAGYALTLDMAKELSMIQRTDKGKQAREYFITMEKRAKQVTLPMAPEEKLMLVMENANRANKRLTGVEERMDEFEANQKMDPTEYSTVSHGVTRAVNRYVGEHHLQLTRDQRAELYKDISTGLNKVCGVHTRTQIRAKDFNRAMKYIYDWEPNTATKMMMQQAGEQTAMEV
ncbi:antA/AntB antirepressor family protein [Levilactobacillus suantsaii]|uniref:Toxin Bro n=1 Tax=Levilactobacillus suantsaii TaxID=2292255 RepID=A0A4V1LF76_9LACO|nr:antA/AntB antirepressor family protein [Levilactobacillus suantsaii]QMU08605.1 antA/AntB antirepressor family protein [Levilactobacillus suantsaii]RXI77353.1 toxin Bro [Levilactobacillus suantsaii]